MQKNNQQCFAFTEGNSYSNVDDTMEGYKIKSALSFKIFSTLIKWEKTEKVLLYQPDI